MADTCPKDMSKSKPDGFLGDYCFAETPMENPNKPIVKSLRCRETSVVKLNQYFDNWNLNDNFTCHRTPFCTDYNRASNKSENLLYDYFSVITEPMLVIHSYQHGAKVKGGIETGVGGRKVEKTNENIVSEIDFVVAHKNYGLLLFEVKDFKEVNVIPTAQEKPRCPLKMITDAEEQLFKKWKQIKDYLQHFFNDETKTNWVSQWKLNDAEFDLLLNNITEETDRRNRSFICLFNCDIQKTYDYFNDKYVFKCNRKNCTCLNEDKKIEITQCQVLTDLLQDADHFHAWWMSYFDYYFFNESLKIFHSDKDLLIYEILLNRFGLDYYLSKWFYKYFEVVAAVDSVAAATRKEKNRFPILWSQAQMNVLQTGELAFIVGPPGSGKTILMVEKIKQILKCDKQDEEDRILIICGANEALEGMLKNSDEYLKRELSRKKDSNRLTIQAMGNWLSIDETRGERFRHIFIDDSQELIWPFLADFLLRNFSTIEDNNRHFWVLRDGSQNRITCTGVLYEVPIEIPSTWKEKKNYFSVFCLQYVFRNTQNGYMSFRPFVKDIMCSYCCEKGQEQRRRREEADQAYITKRQFKHWSWWKPEEKNTSLFVEEKFICKKCKPLVAVDIPGPETIILDFLNDDSACEPHSSQIAEWVFAAIIKGWDTFIDAKNNEEFHINKLRKLFTEGYFQKTAILCRKPEWLMPILESYLKNNGFCNSVTDPKEPQKQFDICCSAKEYFKQDDTNRCYFLIVENSNGIRGIESSVVINYDPFINWNEFTVEELDNYVVSLSRATCLNVILTTEQGKEDLMKSLKYDDCSDVTVAARHVNRRYFEVLPLDRKIPFEEGKKLFQYDLKYVFDEVKYLKRKIFDLF